MLWVTFIFVLVTIVIALILTIVQKIFAVKEDPIVEKIDKLLPQTQCGQCGYPGCMPYAQAVANGDEINKCVPGGQEVVLQLAELLNRPVPEKELETPDDQIAIIDESLCIGCLHCVQACPVDAILGAKKQMHVIIPDYCTGCELCVDPCPVKCISMIDRPKEVDRYSALRKQVNLPKAVTPSSLISIVNAPLDLSKNSSKFKVDNQIIVESSVDNQTLGFNATLKKANQPNKIKTTNSQPTVITTASLFENNSNLSASQNVNNVNNVNTNVTIAESIKPVFVNSDGRVLTDEEVAVRKTRAERRVRRQSEKDKTQATSIANVTTTNTNQVAIKLTVTNSTNDGNTKVELTTRESTKTESVKVEPITELKTVTPEHITTTGVASTDAEAKKTQAVTTTETITSSNATTNTVVTNNSEQVVNTSVTIAESSVTEVAELKTPIPVHVTTTDVASTNADTKKAAIVAAVARMKAKKSQANSGQEQAKEPEFQAPVSAPAIDPKKAAIASAIAKAKAKQTQDKAEQEQAKESEVQTQLSGSQVPVSDSAVDPKKVAIASAIAKAKAKQVQAKQKEPAITSNESKVESVVESQPSDSAQSLNLDKHAMEQARKEAVAKAMELARARKHQINSASQPVDKKAVIASAIAKAKAKVNDATPSSSGTIAKTISRQVPVDLINENHTTTSHYLDDKVVKVIINQVATETAVEMGINANEQDVHPRQATYLAAIAKAKAKAEEKAKAKDNEQHKKSNARSNFASNRQQGDRHVESLISLKDNAQFTSEANLTETNDKATITNITIVANTSLSNTSVKAKSTDSLPLFFNLNTLDENTEIPDQVNIAYVSKYEYTSDIVARLARKLQAQRQSQNSSESRKD